MEQTKRPRIEEMLQQKMYDNELKLEVSGKSNSNFLFKLLQFHNDISPRDSWFSYVFQTSSVATAVSSLVTRRGHPPPFLSIIRNHRCFREELYKCPSSWQFCLCNLFGMVKTWPELKGCWWPPSIGDKEVTTWITWLPDPFTLSTSSKASQKSPASIEIGGLHRDQLKGKESQSPGRKAGRNARDFMWAKQQLIGF